MRIERLSRIIKLVAVVLAVTPALALSDVSEDPDGSLTWQAGVDGVEIEWNPDGSVNRIFSRQGVPVEFPDRRGIKKAQVIAEEKAKAAIIRFLDQTVTSTRVVTEIQADINQARQTRGTGQERKVQKTDERFLVEALTEVTTSFSKGELKGVVVLENGYDETMEEAWVAVGISKKTIDSARQVSGFLSDSNGQPEDESSQDEILNGETEVRKTKMKDW